MENTKKPAEPNVLKVFLSIIDRVVRVFAIEREQIPIIRTRTSTYTTSMTKMIGVDITSISCFYEFIQQADILDYTACLDEKGLVYQIVDFEDPREKYQDPEVLKQAMEVYHIESTIHKDDALCPAARQRRRDEEDTGGNRGC